ncbi:phosphatidylglycerophosphatase A [bacterium]|nr:phosphatidylglycerophosphatase A [bacterium]
MKSPIKNIHEFIATFFLVGKVPKAPGTFGTLAAALIYYFLPRITGIVSKLTGNAGTLTGNAGILPAPSTSGAWSITENSLSNPLFYDSPLWLIFLIAFFFLGVYSSTKAEETMGHDNGHIVIDEVVGYWFAMYLFPPTLYYVVFGFLLFRLFDIAKPYPINKLQNLPKGWGVMVDDLLAGVYAAVILLVIDLIWVIVKPI